MIALTHLVVSFLLIQLLSLDRNDSFIALMFGMFIDFDHILGLNDYVHAHGFSSVLDLDSMTHPDGQWKSLFHNPVAVMVVGPVSIGSRMAIPLVFWGVHLVMDYVQESFLGVFSFAEMALLSAAMTSLLLLRFRRHRALHGESTFASYLACEVGCLGRSIRALLGSIVPARSS